ncbi:RCC1 domain-containing protein, partial [Streptomyces bacillaris]|uniref:RCC1 domain-containing protein n=1 Tax=Streptomyces bacillaris TaxID=68179 RepID=UPI0036DD2584
FGRIGGPQADTVLSHSGLALPDVIYAGQVVGVLIVKARAVVIHDGKQQVATAETFIRISASTTKIVPLSAGYKGSGALGSGSKTNNPVPAAVAMPASAGSVTLIGAGLYRAGFALDDAGTVWSWGADYYHTQAVRKDQWSPVAFATSSMPKDIVQLEGTYYAMFALTSSGEVWGWGYNREGQFADGTYNATYREIPVRIPNIGPVKKLAGGHYNMHALLEDGTLWNWGYGRSGSLGNSNAATHRVLTPTQVTGFPPGRTVVDVAGRNDGASAVLDDGTVWSWGLNSSYQIGDGTNVRRLVPTQVASLAGAQRVYSNYLNVGVVLADATCRVWGVSTAYALGNGSTTNPRVPVDPGLTNVSSLSWGYRTGHALLTDGSVYGWGYNGNYETGTGVRGTIQKPLRVPGIGAVKQIAQ